MCLRVCRQARTPQEVAAYSQFRLTGFFPTLRAYWRMDEGSGAAVPDMSGNGHEAEMVRRCAPPSLDPSPPLPRRCSPPPHTLSHDLHKCLRTTHNCPRPRQLTTCPPAPLPPSRPRSPAGPPPAPAHTRSPAGKTNAQRGALEWIYAPKLFGGSGDRHTGFVRAGYGTPLRPRRPRSPRRPRRRLRHPCQRRYVSSPAW